MIAPRALAAAALAVAAIASLVAQAPPLRVTIVSPEDDAYVSGPTTLRADVVPPDAAAAVAFFVDGRQVCRVTRPPYDCEWDAGAAIVEHQIRVVASAAGGRAVATAAIKGVAFAEMVDVELVQVTATVTDGRNKYVTRLPQSAFRVFEDGKPQTISHFASEGVPVDLVLAIDVSESMRDAVPTLKTTVREFLTAIPARDRVTVLGFNDKIFTLARKATDAAERVRAVDRMAPWGATALYDVVIAGTDLLGRESGRKAMVIFTDGEDEGSHASIVDAERRLQASDITLYMIGQGRGTKIERLKKVMTRLAEATGGRALVTEKIDDLRSAFAELLDELSNQYVLGYAPTNSRHDGTLRQLKVEVDGHHRVRAREAYRAPEPRKLP